MESIKKWFTGADVKGAATRTVLSAGGMIVFVLGVLNADPALIAFVKENIGPVATGVGFFVWLLSEGYRILYKTNSDKAQEAAKAVDKGIAAGTITEHTPIEIQTPAGVENLPVAQPK